MKTNFRFDIGNRVIVPTGQVAVVIGNHTNGSTNSAEIEFQLADKIERRYTDERLLSPAQQ